MEKRIEEVRGQFGLSTVGYMCSALRTGQGVATVWGALSFSSVLRGFQENERTDSRHLIHLSPGEGVGR